MVRLVLLCLVVSSFIACVRGATPNGHDTEAASVKAEQQLRAASTRPAAALTPVEAELIAHGPRTERRIALTFDACTTRNVSQYDARITRELVSANAKATIFLGGGWAKEEADHVKELAANPLFELGNHSYTHPHMARIVDAKRLDEELLKTQSEVFELTGQTPRLFRPPYGEYNERLVKAAAQAGLTTVEYDLPSGDPDQHATKERLVEWVPFEHFIGLGHHRHACQPHPVSHRGGPPGHHLGAPRRRVPAGDGG